MEKIWLKSYPPGIPAEINPDAYQSIVEVLEKSFHQYAKLPAFYSLGKTITYKELDKYSRDFAAYLQQVLKLKKGDRIAIMLPNVLQYPVAMFGALRAGLAVINVNPLYTPDELRFQLTNSGAETIIALENFAHTVEKANAPQLKNIIITKGGDMLSFVRGFITNFMLKYVLKKIPAWHIPNAITFKTVMSQGHQKSFTPPTIQNGDTAFIQYTGGTTGISKGAVLTHRNIIANLQQAEAWFKNLLVDRQEVIVTALPLYHIFSLTANCLFFTKMGGLNILIVNPRDIPFTIREMKKFKFTAITGVNTLFNALLKDPHFQQLDFSKLRLSLGGGMAVQKVVAEHWQEVTKAPLLEAYGLTETSPCVTINPTNLKSYNGTIGLPVSSTEICIIDENHRELPVGEVGELAIKGPQVMQGYWQNPSETEKVFTKDGWLLTGDMASVDENGFVTLHERKKDMILVSGFNVYPNEVEAVIAKIHGVREVAVVGVPDENSGEAVRAYVVKEDPNLTSEAIITETRKHLTSYKIPRKIEFCDDLPKTNVGKILRRALRERAV